jgi:hypothetical protein
LLHQHPALRQELAAQLGLVPNMPPPAAGSGRDTSSMQRAASAAGEPLCMCCPFSWVPYAPLNCHAENY